MSFVNAYNDREATKSLEFIQRMMNAGIKVDKVIILIMATSLSPNSSQNQGFRLTFCNSFTFRLLDIKQMKLTSLTIYN